MFTDLYDSIKSDPKALRAQIADAVRLSQPEVLLDIQRQAQLFATWGMALAQAERDAKLQRLEIDETILPTARLQAEAFLKEQERKVTIQAKDDIAHSDPTYKMASRHLVEQEMLCAILKSTVEALRHKRDMIQSLNSRQKVELTSIPYDRWEAPGTGVIPPSYDSTQPDGDSSSGTRRAHRGPETEAEVKDQIESLSERYREMRKVRA